MPAVTQVWTSDEKRPASRYVLPIAGGAPTASGVDALRELRRDAAKTLTDLHALNKSLSASGRNQECKDLKQVIRYFTQLEKAASLVIGHAVDFGRKSTSDWPQEFSDLIDWCRHIVVGDVSPPQLCRVT